MMTRISCCTLITLLLSALNAGNAIFAQDSHLIVLVRIPGSLIPQQDDQEFRHTTQVDQVVLGTHSRGIATCDGIVTFRPESNDQGVTLLFCVKGRVESMTNGVNGPATIQSKATTTYEAKKQVFFDGERLVTLPATISAKTSVQVTGIGSTLPGLRGRLVTRIALRKSRDSHAEAQAIVGNRTKQDLLKHVDTELDGKVADINEQITKHLQVLHMIVNKDDLQTRSDPNFIEVCYGSDSVKQVPINKRFTLPPTGVELWVKTDATGELEKVTVATLLAKASHWMASRVGPSRNLFALD